MQTSPIFSSGRPVVKDGDRPPTRKWDSLVTLVGFYKNENAPWSILNCPEVSGISESLPGRLDLQGLRSRSGPHFVTCLLCKFKNADIA